jgi:hypothetical protein
MSAVSIALAAMCAGSIAAASAARPMLKPDLEGVSFLVGRWDSGEGKVLDVGGVSTGSVEITAEANGEALLSRAHTDVFDAKGKPLQSFDQILLIFPEAGTLRAVYSDGQHVIHYTAASVAPGKSVTFTSAANGGPVFTLRYEMKPPDTLAITFGITPPGESAFHPIAVGTLKKRS